uniref:Uncharacterized protein n=1 Tax=Euplotes harpa TaxID=151035 RepID=A0A7S3N9B3_9SPIT|mmetsp:Transcript_20788/g.24024  ORF Transcript_20788/g.24024 Transcript_20788/m.24024 type:complete len:145 (+) Transcript_20788:21-455(+)
MEKTNQMYQNSSAYDSNNIKKQLIELEKYISQVNSEITYHKNEVQIMRSETDTLEQVLTLKAHDVKKSMLNEIERVEEDINRSLNQQQTENSRIQQQITSLNGEKISLQQNLLHLERRLGDLEMQVGEDLHGTQQQMDYMSSYA